MFAKLQSRQEQFYCWRVGHKVVPGLASQAELGLGKVGRKVTKRKWRKEHEVGREEGREKLGESPGEKPAFLPSPSWCWAWCREGAGPLMLTDEGARG